MLKLHPEVEQVLTEIQKLLLLPLYFTYYLYFCCLLTEMFTLLVGEEVMAGEDVIPLHEKITGK